MAGRFKSLTLQETLQQWIGIIMGTLANNTALVQGDVEHVFV
jgi:hypothetical protein